MQYKLEQAKKLEEMLCQNRMFLPRRTMENDIYLWMIRLQSLVSQVFEDFLWSIHQQFHQVRHIRSKMSVDVFFVFECYSIHNSIAGHLLPPYWFLSQRYFMYAHRQSNLNDDMKYTHATTPRHFKASIQFYVFRNDVISFWLISDYV